VSETNETISSGRKPLLLGIGLLGVIAAVALVWYFVFRDDSPARVTTGEAAQAREDALSEAGGDEVIVLDGTWEVDTSVGTFDSSCLTEVCGATFAGFRINEELARIGAKTVVGRTPVVTGTLVLDGSQVLEVDIIVDMTELVTDSDRRNGAIRQQAIETSIFPDASFSLVRPIDLGGVPEAGTSVEVTATGDFTIHGVTRSETIALIASFDGTRISVVGELGPVLLADYDIAQPSAVTVLSVEDNAIIELQVFFSKTG
jgi:polyisoprenoid-binding protein YceI